MHDWPGSFTQFSEVIGPLSRDFHVIVTSTPGVGFSGPLTSAGWNTGKIASAFIEVLDRLGYERFGVQGGGGGAWIATEIARQAPEKVIGVHVNGLVTFPSDDPADFAGLTEGEQERLARLQNFRDDMMGFNVQQSTRPQTLAFGLHDSPVGQLAWIVEKFKEFTDPEEGLPEDSIDRDRILTDVSIYWLTGTAASAAQIYYEEITAGPQSGDDWGDSERGTVPTGVLVSSHDITIRPWAERDHHIVHWTELDEGGHFLAMERPELLVDDVRTFFRKLR
jgi:pimeloyl-ACP methyl ester carboxylesterase